MIYKLKPDGSQEYTAPDGEIVIIPVPSNEILERDGPVIPVSISQPSKLLLKGQESLQVDCMALIDSGASISIITPKVVDQLDLSDTGYKNIISVHSVEERPVYFGRITFPWGGGIETSLVCCDLQGYDCLIGRDILRHWLMVYDGVNGEITICD
jgi:hypothetical protein